jgi:Coenzyme PQQ synthesis protein D (PqqD)
MSEQDIRSHDTSNIIWSIVDDEALLLDASSGDYFSLNPIGTEIWECLQRGDSLSHIVETIAEKYDVEEVIVRRDVTELIEELRAAKLLKNS